MSRRSALSLLLVLLGTLAYLGFCSEPIEEAPLVEPVAERQRVQGLLRLARLMGGASSCPPTDAGCRVQTPLGLEVARQARYLLDHPTPGFRDDCSGFVSAAFSELGVPIDGIVATIWDSAVLNDALHWDPVPHVGDLVFFDNTHDRDGDGRWNDPLTHIGLIVSVSEDGTAAYAHSGTSQGKAMGWINVQKSGVYREKGRIINSYLREPAPGDPATAGYLSGELWVGFATVDAGQDWRSWVPGFEPTR